MAKVILENISKSFNSNKGLVRVLQEINLTIEDGEFMVLVGPSGCGKSTLLRCIAGLETVSQGYIYIGDRIVNSLAPKARDIAMVFQNYALYPHLNVYDNIAFGLRRLGQFNPFLGMKNYVFRKFGHLSAREQKIQQQVLYTAQLLQIESFLNRLPKQLSGGQKQRVALGRAIARNPQVFLMDEPLSNLDAKLRTETRANIVKLQRQLATTTIYVTHDQIEAMTMGDRIAVLNQGKIQQIATPLELYNKPANRFVAEFIGSPPMNFLPVKVTGNSQISYQQYTFNLPKSSTEILNQKSLLLGIRPEHFKLSKSDSYHLIGKVELVEALGNDTYITVTLDEKINMSLQVRISPQELVKVGETIYLDIQLDKIHLFDAETEEKLR